MRCSPVLRGVEVGLDGRDEDAGFAVGDENLRRIDETLAERLGGE